MKMSKPFLRCHLILYKKLVNIHISENCVGSSFPLLNLEFIYIVNVIRFEDHIKIYREEIGWKREEWIHLAQDIQIMKQDNEGDVTLDSIRCRHFLHRTMNFGFTRRTKEVTRRKNNLP
jgi:hypothetical protein